MNARAFDRMTIQGLVRARIKGGGLPPGEPDHVWGGYGDGGACVVCEQPIGPDEVEYELVFRPDGHDVTARLHIVCYSAWQVEVQSTGSAGE